jgi:hypothetical protein
VPNTVSAGVYSIPMIASWPLGTMLNVTGTAATQYSRVAAEAGGAASRLAAPANASAASRLTER